MVRNRVRADRAKLRCQYNQSFQCHTHTTHTRHTHTHTYTQHTHTHTHAIPPPTTHQLFRACEVLVGCVCVAAQEEEGATLGTLRGHQHQLCRGAAKCEGQLRVLACRAYAGWKRGTGGEESGATLKNLAHIHTCTHAHTYLHTHTHTSLCRSTPTSCCQWKQQWPDLVSTYGQRV